VKDEKRIEYYNIVSNNTNKNSPCNRETSREYEIIITLKVREIDGK